MTTSDSISPEEHATRRLTRQRLAIAALGMFALLAVACGIDFGEASSETEIFKDLKIDGPFIAGEPLKMTLSYARQYDVKLEVKCDLLSVEDIPTVTPLPTGTVSPLALGPTPEPTLPIIPLARPTPTNKVQEIFGTTFQPNEDGGPVGEATPILDALEHRFFAPGPGEYLVWCYTPRDLTNAIFEDLSIPE